MKQQSRILLVDDDPTTEAAVRGPLERDGFVVDYAEEGYAAIEKLRAYEYRAVVLDLIIHRGLNGFGVLNFIEVEQPSMLDRVFLVTGMSEQTVMNTAPKLLGRLYRKPFDTRRLVAAVTAIARPDGPRKPLAEKCLLIIDDDRLSAELVAVFARRLGLTPHFAENGREAIQKMVETEYDAIVLDLLMPGIDGFGVLDYLSRVRPEVLSHTLVVSALPERYRERIKQYPICATVAKPFDHNQMVEALRHCVKAEDVSPERRAQ